MRRSQLSLLSLVLIVFIALVSFLTARLGFLFALENGNVSLIWPASGIGLALVLLLGKRVLPALWVGSLIANLGNTTPLLASMGIATGNTLMVFAGAYMLQKAGFQPKLQRVYDVLILVCCGMILSPLISATVGIFCLTTAGQISGHDPLQSWLTWWLGDGMGILLVTPVLLIRVERPLRLPSLRHVVEGLVLILLLVLTSWLVFNQEFTPTSFYPLAYLIFPFLVWAALRFDPRMVISLMLLVSIIAVIGMMHEFDHFGEQVLWDSLLFLWTYLATITITVLLLAATLCERRQIQRTASSLEQRFSTVFQAAPLGIVLTTIGEGRFVDVNEEFCRLSGYTREETVGRTSTELNIWMLPNERDRMLKALEQQGRVTQFDLHLRAKSGEIRHGMASIEIIELDGKPHLLTMFQDLTQRMAVETALQQSEERYRELFEGIDDAIFVHDLEANILDVNESACHRLGYTREELLRMKVTDLDSPDFAAGFQERLRRQLTHGSLSQIEGVQLTKDGREIFIDVNTKLITYKGQPAVLALDRDITDRKLAEQKLRESEARYRAVVEDQTEMICRFSLDWTLTFVNGAYCRYFGTSRDQLIGTQFIDLIHEEDRQRILNVLTSLSAENPVMISENRGIMPDGSVRWHQWIDHAITDESGQIIEYQSVGKDITQLKEMENERLSVALEREKVRILADFIAAASHDFRTPLSVINTSAYLLNRAPDTQQRERYFQAIQEQTYHVERLVEGLLTMARLDRGDIFRFKLIDLNGLIRQVETQKRGQTEEKLLSLVVDLESQLPQIEADEDWLYRCVIRLVENAIQYTPEGGTIVICTRVKGERQQQRVILEVRDNGVGISAADLPRIFDRLYRGEGHRPVGGQGLGLSIARKIVEGHQGSIEVESEPGVGSTFRVWLPIRQSDTSAAPSPSL